MPSTTTETDIAGLRASLDAARSRPCLLCGTSDDGVLRRCPERHHEVERLLVIARGTRNELAFVPVFWDGAGELGCAEFDGLALLRSPALCDMDRDAEEAGRVMGGRLWVAGSYEDDFLKKLIRAARMVIAWDVGGVYPAVDGSALREAPRPARTLVDVAAPCYGRWPAPWLPWVSVSAAIPWSEPPFRPRARNSGARLPKDAFAAVGLPPLEVEAHPLAKALILAALLRSVPWTGERKTLGARLLPPPHLSMASVGIYQGQVYRSGPGGQWERLFATGQDDRAVGLREVELAEGHMRMADQAAACFPHGGNHGNH